MVTLSVFYKFIPVFIENTVNTELLARKKIKLYMFFRSKSH